MLIIVCIICLASLAAEAARYDVPVNGRHSLVFLDCRVLRRDKGNPEDGLNLYYDDDNKTLYISVHGGTRGELRGVRDPYSMMKNVDWWIHTNYSLIKDLDVRKLMLIACHQEARRNGRVQLGRSRYFDVDMTEYGYSNGVVTETWSQSPNGRCKMLITCADCYLHKASLSHKRAIAAAPSWGKKLIRMYEKDHR